MPEHRKKRIFGQAGNTLLRFAILAAAVLMIALGAQTSEVQTMFRKAIYICMECIGLG